ncbi:MAG: hypothetical protein M1833_007372 [Piccolia ochrophora]|nr:MAG: hypothetical protein M1833_007372 [Piccolia ochrophora]
MSYASAAAKGPKQSPEEPTINPSDHSTESLVDVDSDHVNTVPSDYKSQAVKTDTQAERIEHEAEDKERELEAEYKKAKREGKAKASEGKAQAKKTAGEAKNRLSAAGQDFRENSDNPVVVGNAVIIAVAGAALGFGAYKKYSAGELDWKLAGIWTGAIGLFATGDYYLSQYLFKNKYPKK